MLNQFVRTRSIPATVALCLSTFTTVAQSDGHPAVSAHAGYRVSGTVVSKTDGHPLDRTRLLLRDIKATREPRSVVTSEDGKFSFEDVSAGKYSLEGLKSGFVPAAYDQHDQFSTAIATGAGVDTEHLLLKLSPQAIIAGKVLDEAGDPARHAAVMLYRNDHFQGIDQVHGFGNAQTDDLGAYEFSVGPGTYFLSVRAQPWYAIHPPAAESDERGADGNLDPNLDVAYSVAYYENATETDDATPIEVRGGEHLQVDMQLNPVPALRLIFHVAVNANRGVFFPQLEQAGFDSSAYVQATPRLISPGVVELSGIPAGRYNVRIPGENTFTQMNGIDLGKDGEEVDTSTAEVLGTVKVLATVPGESSIPQGLAIGLIRARTAVGGFHSLGAQGEAEIQQVPAGTYEVQLLGGPKAYAITGISADGAQVRGHTISVPAGASASLALTLGVGRDVQGVAKKAGKPLAEAMVVLVPKNPEGNRTLFRRDQSDLDGTFNLRGVVPGSYTLLSIEDGWDLDWSRPEIIARYVKRGRPVELRGVTSSPLQVKEAVEVQSK